MKDKKLDLVAIRRRLKLSQEAIARVLMVSWVSVNRWENAHSYPRGASLEIYKALDIALDRGCWKRGFVIDEDDPGRKLYLILDAAYGRRR